VKERFLRSSGDRITPVRACGMISLSFFHILSIGFVPGNAAPICAWTRNQLVFNRSHGAR
jgi:hypothetical protein